MHDEHAEVEVDEHIDAPPAEVFEYVADPARRPFGDDARVQFGPEIERDEPSRIAWRVTTSDGDVHRDGRVDIVVAPDGAGSRVRVSHHIGAPVAPQARAELAIAA